MKMNGNKGIIRWGLVCIVFFASFIVLQAGIVPTNQYAWSENAGWQNWLSTSNPVPVTVSRVAADGSYYLSGYVWEENNGWFKLGADAGGPYANTASTNWGVNMTSDGVLSGYAWSENVGWVNFNSPSGGVTMAMDTGDFAGYAWSESAGWINMNGMATNGATYLVSNEQAAPTVSNWPTASAITYGQAHSNSTMSGGSASVDGDFAFTSLSNKPDAGPSTPNVTFTPDDVVNYLSVTGEVSLTVNQLALSVTGAVAQGKVYDGTISATISGGSLSGVLGSDDVTLGNAATGTFASASVAVDIAVTSYMTLGGTAAGNYSLAQPTLAADITQAGQTITFPSISDQVVTSLVELAATADSGLSVSFTVGSGSATINGDTNLSFTSHGQVSIVASQTGNQDYVAAPDVTNSFRVYGIFTVSVHTVYGTATPVTGDYAYIEDTIITNTVTTPETHDTTQYMCTGWASSACDPVSGTTNICVMTVTNTTDLTWLWTTNYWLEVIVGAQGSVDTENNWQQEGSSPNLTATASNYYHFSQWDVLPGGIETSNPLAVLMTGSKSATAWFAANLTTNTDTPEWWMASFGLTNFEADAVGDIDNDGVPTYQEFIGDTIPTNPASLLELDYIGMGVGLRQIEWIGGTGVIQYLEWSTHARDGSSWVIVATNTPPTPITNQVDVSENDETGFYRIRAVR